jgi:hypothetical protein
MAMTINALVEGGTSFTGTPIGEHFATSEE